jgi:hypothetical protein
MSLFPLFTKYRTLQKSGKALGDGRRAAKKASTELHSMVQVVDSEGNVLFAQVEMIDARPLCIGSPYDMIMWP